MADDKIHPGDISTYRNAPEQFLRQRRDDLQVQIFHPVLGPAEFLQRVVAPAALTSGALGYSAWRAVGGLMDWLIRSDNHWFRDHWKTKGGKISYMLNATRYEEALVGNSEMLGGLLTGQETTGDVIDRILRDTEELGHTTGRDRLLDFVRDQSPEYLKSRESVRDFLRVLEDIHRSDPQAHIGQYHLIATRIQELAAKQERAGERYTKLGRDAFFELKDKIIGQGHRDNEEIVNKRRAPLVIALTTAVALIGGIRAFTTTRRQKMLDMESETSFIDRRLDQLEDAKAAAYEDAGEPRQMDGRPKGKHAQRLEESRIENAASAAAPMI